MSDRYLGIYLNDHLAGATTGLELARRVRGSNEGTDLGRFLDDLVTEIEEDRETLEAVMDRLGVATNPVKRLGGWVAEKAGRLKLNGQLLGYSPLSRLLELEMLHIGVTGKLELWKALDATVGTELAEFDLGRLVERAESQRRRLERQRLDAARNAFSRATASTP
jgi:hypothetical protein